MKNKDGLLLLPSFNLNIYYCIHNYKIPIIYIITITIFQKKTPITTDKEAAKVEIVEITS